MRISLSRSRALLFAVCVFESKMLTADSAERVAFALSFSLAHKSLVQNLFSLFPRAMSTSATPAFACALLVMDRVCVCMFALSRSAFLDRLSLSLCVRAQKAAGC